MKPDFKPGELYVFYGDDENYKRLFLVISNKEVLIIYSTHNKAIIGKKMKIKMLPTISSKSYHYKKLN